MKLDAVVKMAIGVAHARSRCAALDVCRSALQRAFGADAAVIWLPPTTSGEADDLFVAGAAVPAAAEREILRATAAGRLKNWLGGRGVGFYCSAEVPMPGGGRAGLVAVAWRQNCFMHARADEFVELVAEQLGAVLAIKGPA